MIQGSGLFHAFLAPISSDFALFNLRDYTIYTHISTITLDRYIAVTFLVIPSENVDKSP
jgi:hypothetical protein